MTGTSFMHSAMQPGVCTHPAQEPTEQKAASGVNLQTSPWDFQARAGVSIQSRPFNIYANFPAYSWGAHSAMHTANSSA